MHLFTEQAFKEFTGVPILGGPDRKKCQEIQLSSVYLRLPYIRQMSYPYIRNAALLTTFRAHRYQFFDDVVGVWF